MPYGKLLTTTPSLLDLPEGKFCSKMIENACPFVEEFYDYDEDFLHEFIFNNSDNDFIYIKFSYKQLGRSEKWFLEQCRALENDMLAIKRELLLEWTYASDSGVFNEEQLTALSKFVIESEEYMIVRDYWKFNIYKKLDITVPYIISVDVAGGLDQDNSAISFIHPKTLKVDASFRNNRINPTELSMVLHDIGMNYFPYAGFVIENNSYGRVVITNLLYSPIASRIFCYVDEKQKDIKKPSKLKNKDNKIYGIPTTTKSRAEMINDLLPLIVNDEPEVITCPYIFQDIRNLERKKTGKIEHRDGEHDDNLMSYLLGRWALGYAKHSNINAIIMRSGFDEETQEKNKAIADRLDAVTRMYRNPAENLGHFSYMFMGDILDKEMDPTQSYSRDTKFNAMMKVINMNK